MSGGKVDVRDMTILLWPEKAVTCSLAMPSPPSLRSFHCFFFGHQQEFHLLAVSRISHIRTYSHRYKHSDLTNEYTVCLNVSVCLCSPMKSSNHV